MNHVVEGSELLKKAREVAEAIMKNNRDMVLRYKAVINDGVKIDLHHALLLEKVYIYICSILELNCRSKIEGLLLSVCASDCCRRELMSIIME